MNASNLRRGYSCFYLWVISISYLPNGPLTGPSFILATSLANFSGSQGSSSSDNGLCASSLRGISRITYQHVIIGESHPFLALGTPSLSRLIIL